MRTLTPRLARRKMRVSANIIGSSDKPRIALHRSNKYTYAQAIDDASHATIASSSSKQYEKADVTKSQAAKLAGESLAKLMLAASVKRAVIDRGRFTYRGRIAAFVDGMREAGIQV